MAAATAVAGGVARGANPVALPVLPDSRPKDGDIKWEKAPCRFCGTGCHVQVGVKEGRVVAIAGDQMADVNKGLLCVKGYHVGLILYGKDRLTTPMLRKNGRLEPITWDEAVDVIARRIMKDPAGFALYGSGQWTIGEGCAGNKLMKAGLGSNQIDGNPRLRKAVTDARGQAMPADTIKRAIQRGTGELEGANYEEIIYEGTGPGGTLFIVDALTDNKNRTVAEIRKVFERSNGALGSSGTAGWAFDRKGIITLAKEVANEDQLMEIAVGAGADDYTDQGEEWQITCTIDTIDPVVKALEDAKIVVKSSGPGYIPKNKKLVTGRDAELCLVLFEALDDHDDSQNVYADFDVSDEELAKMEG